MALTLEEYATQLHKRDLPWPAPPEVQPPKAKPFLTHLPEIRAVTWNVYGTLLAITGGELLFEHPNAFIMDMALDKTIQEFKMWASMTRKAGKPSEYMRQIYVDLVRNQSLGATKHPEKSVDRIWEAIVKKLLQKDYKFDAAFYGALNEFSGKIAYFFHASLQGTACYEDAAQTLADLAEKGVAQALVDDGQCFTEVQLQRGLQRQDEDFNLDNVIESEMRFLSFKVGVKKPSETLFRKALDALNERDITPQQVLHVGSRVEKDIIPAKKLGMRTALFAGDSASLQATPDQLKTAASRPDVLLTRLDQIIEVVAGPSA